MLEITVISAQGLKNSSFSLFSHHHLKPFITITTSCNPINGYNTCHVYTSRVDHDGGSNPTWGDKFLLPLDPTFNYSYCLYLHLFTKRVLLSPSLLGWIQIPVSDIFDAHFPLGLRLTHHLSYRLRKRDGSRGHGIVNVACRFVGEVPVIRHSRSSDVKRLTQVVDECHTVTGIPVTAWQMRMKCRDKMDNVTRNTNM